MIEWTLTALYVVGMFVAMAVAAVAALFVWFLIASAYEHVPRSIKRVTDIVLKVIGWSVCAAMAALFFLMIGLRTNAYLFPK